MTGSFIQIEGDFVTNGYVLSFVSDQPVTFPPFTDYTQMTSQLLQFNPGVDLVAQLDGAGLLLSYYLSEYQQFQPQQQSGDVLFGDGNVLRIDEDETCDEEACDPLLSVDNVTVTPDALAANPVTIGELSRTKGPAVLPIF